MYLAIEELIEPRGDGTYRRVFPGQEVRSFASWPVKNQLAALNSHQVREAPDQERSLDYVLGMPGDFVATEAAKDRAYAAAIGKDRAAAEVAQPAPAPVAPPAMPAVGMPNAEPAAIGATDADFVCSKCDYVAKTARGLAIHMGKEHKNA